MQSGSFGRSDEDNFLTVEIPPGTPKGAFALIHVLAHEVDPLDAPDDWTPVAEGAMPGTRWSGVYHVTVGDVRSWTVPVNSETSYTVAVTDGIADVDPVQWVKAAVGVGDLAVCDTDETETDHTTLVVLAHQASVSHAADILSDARLIPAAKNLHSNAGLGTMFAGFYWQTEQGETPPFEFRFVPVDKVTDYTWSAWVVALNPASAPEPAPVVEPPAEEDE